MVKPKQGVFPCHFQKCNFGGVEWEIVGSCVLSPAQSCTGWQQVGKWESGG